MREARPRAAIKLQGGNCNVGKMRVNNGTSSKSTQTQARVMVVREDCNGDKNEGGQQHEQQESEQQERAMVVEKT